MSKIENLVYLIEAIIILIISLVYNEIITLSKAIDIVFLVFILSIFIGLYVMREPYYK